MDNNYDWGIQSAQTKVHPTQKAAVGNEGNDSSGKNLLDI